MTNPIHTHTLELDITVAGVTKTHELCVMYTYTAAIRGGIMGGVNLLDEPVPAQVKIHDLKVIVDFGGKETKTEYSIPMECKCLSPEHIMALEAEILEQMNDG